MHSCCVQTETLSSMHFNPFFLCLSLLLLCLSLLLPLFLSVYPPPPSLCHTPTPPSLSVNFLPFFCLSNYNFSPLLPLSASPSVCLHLLLSVHHLPLPVSSLSSFISFCSVKRFLKPLEKLSRPRYVPYTGVTGAHTSIYATDSLP